MFVSKSIYDEWIDNVDEGCMIENISWNDAENLIKSLDGKKFTQVIFSNEQEDAFICVGGGNNGLYNVFITLDDNESFYDLINSNVTNNEIIQLVTGGQLGDFESFICVSIVEVLKAVKTFYEKGIPDESLVWKYRN